jgi:hypothetical protein
MSMKPISLTGKTLSVLVLCAAGLPSFAQTQGQVQSQGQITPPSSSVAPPTPEPVVVETRVDLTTGEPQSPESLADAQKEANAALAEARVACRREAARQARAECLRQAQDDYKDTLARAQR